MKLEFWRHDGFFVCHATKLKSLLTKPILVKAKVDNHVLDCCAQKAAPVSRFYKVSIWGISRNLLTGGGLFGWSAVSGQCLAFWGVVSRLVPAYTSSMTICASEMLYLLTCSSSSHEDRKRWMVLSQKSHAWPVQGLWQHSVALWRSLAEFKVLRTFFSHFVVH